MSEFMSKWVRSTYWSVPASWILLNYLETEKPTLIFTVIVFTISCINHRCQNPENPVGDGWQPDRRHNQTASARRTKSSTARQVSDATEWTDDCGMSERPEETTLARPFSVFCRQLRNMDLQKLSSRLHHLNYYYLLNCSHFICFFSASNV